MNKNPNIQQNNEMNDKLYQTVMSFSFILFLIITVVCVVCLLDFNKSLSAIDVEASRNSIDNISYRQEESQKQIEAASMTFQSLLKEAEKQAIYDEKVKTIAENYVTRSEFNTAKTMFENLDDVDVYDYSDVLNKVNDATGLVNSNNEQVEYLTNNLEDKTNITDDSSETSVSETEFISANGLEDKFVEAFDYFYPIGSIYVSVDGNVPDHGTWEQLDLNRTLWSDHDGDGTLVEPTLPNVKGKSGAYLRNASSTGAFVQSGIGAESGGNKKIGWQNKYMDLSRANPIFQSGATVRPPAFAVTIFKRVG